MDESAIDDSLGPVSASYLIRRLLNISSCPCPKSVGRHYRQCTWHLVVIEVCPVYLTESQKRTIEPGDVSFSWYYYLLSATTPGFPLSLSSRRSEKRLVANPFPQLFYPGSTLCP